MYPAGVGVGQSRIHRAEPKLRLFIPWCAGRSRDERLVRKWCYGPSIPTLNRTNPHNRHSRAAKRQSRNRRQSPQGQCSAGACPPLGPGLGMAESTARIRRIKPQLRVFIPRPAGASRHERLVRMRVPDSYPGCALQLTSMPALHARNLPNRRPTAEGGTRERSAVEDYARRGACPPLGSGWGMSESAVPSHNSIARFRR